MQPKINKFIKKEEDGRPDPDARRQSSTTSGSLMSPSPLASQALKRLGRGQLALTSEVVAGTLKGYSLLCLWLLSVSFLFSFIKPDCQQER